MQTTLYLDVQSQRDAHGCATLMAHIPGATVIREWRGSALAEFGVAHKQMNLPARFLMVDDAFSIAHHYTRSRVHAINVMSCINLRRPHQCQQKLLAML